MRSWVIRGLIASVVVLLAGAAWFYGPALKPVSTATQAKIEGGALPPGCACHSKDQRLTSMHGLFGIKDCRKCHGKNEDLTGRKSSEMTPMRRAALEKRMKTEEICGQCHRSGKIVTSAKRTAGADLFCPQEKKSYTKAQAIEKGDGYICPKDETTRLIDVADIAAKSAAEPKNEYCVACHPYDRDHIESHTKLIKASNRADSKDCLSCHKSHSDCDSCHWR